MAEFRCIQCDAALTIAGAPAHRVYRCARCGQSNYFVDSGTAQPKCQLAWRSFYCGIAVAVIIAAVLMLLFYLNMGWVGASLGPVLVPLGAAALYFGIKSLLRNRYRKASASNKMAAATGTITGGCGGVMFGGLITVGLLVALIISTATYQLNEPDEVQQLADEHFSVQLPSEDWVPSVADVNPGLGIIEFWDQKNFEQGRSRFYVSFMPSMLLQGPAAETNLKIPERESMERIHAGQRKKVEVEQTRTLTWQINNEPTEVRKEVWRRKEADDGGDEFVTYQCTFMTKPRGISMVFLCKLPDVAFDDEQVQKVFESFDPVE